jgi:O-antigen ligase
VFGILLDNNPYLSKCLFASSIFCLSIVSIDGIYQYINNSNFLGYEKYNSFRLTGFFGKEPILGRYIAYLSIFTFALINQNFKKTKKMIILSIAFLTICEVVVFLTGERAPFLILTLFTILIIVFIPYYRIYRVIGVFISIIILTSIMYFNPAAKQRMVDNTFAQINQTQLPFLPYTTHHEEHYISALKMFVDKPISGLGANTFRLHCSKDKYIYSDRSCSSHPHNFYIQTLAELGIVGFLFLFSFFIYLMMIVLKQLLFVIKFNIDKQIPFKDFLLPMVLFIYWWPLIPQMSFYNNWNNVLLMLPLGFFMRYLYSKK